MIKFIKNNQYLGFGIGGIIIIIAAVALLGGGFVWYEQQTQKQVTHSGGIADTKRHKLLLQRKVQNLIDNNLDTSTWKTYRNEKYGFEVRYPPTLSEKKIDESNIAFLGEPVIEIGVTLNKFNPDNITGIYGRANNPKRTDIDSHVGYQFSEADGGCRWTWIRTNIEENTLSIRFTSCEGDKILYDDMFISKILSTFKFIPSISSGQVN